VPLRVGYSLRPSTDTDIAAEARHAESLGFDLITWTDHLAGSRPTFETWTALTWAAAATERIRLGSNVLGLPYRHPAVTAKMAEALHRLSRGRLILGLGGGGSDAEFQAFGLPVRRPKEKVDALEEAVEVMRRLWSGDAVTYRGEHYSLEAGQIAPPPERPIPLWLGVYGRRSLGIAGRMADGWIPSIRFAPPERWKEMRDLVQRSAEAAGRDLQGFDFACNIAVRVDERAEGRAHVITGSPERVAEELGALIEMGITFPILWAVGDGFEQRERLASEVFPRLGSSRP
jgi:alkanesulfonate monooxygenase SsuD/methylene tetrahydromethanopterin reductase-like flavin-dependent oxidoreductase (luciferase family)